MEDCRYLETVRHGRLQVSRDCVRHGRLQISRDCVRHGRLQVSRDIFPVSPIFPGKLYRPASLQSLHYYSRSERGVLPMIDLHVVLL